MTPQQTAQIFAMTTHCPKCHVCFCGTAKLQAIDGIAICMNCKPGYEQQLRQSNELPPADQMYPQ